MSLFVVFFILIATCVLCCSRTLHRFFVRQFERNKKSFISNSQQQKKRLFRFFCIFGAVLGVSFVLYRVHTRIIPLPLVTAIFSSFDSDQKSWEFNIEKGKHGDLGAVHENWSRKQGFGYQYSRFWQEELWQNWPSYLFGIIFLLAAVLLGSYFFWCYGEKRLTKKESGSPASKKPLKKQTRVLKRRTQVLDFSHPSMVVKRVDELFRETKKQS